MTYTLFRIFIFLATGTYVLIPSMALSAHRQYSNLKSTEDGHLQIGLNISGFLIKDHNYDDSGTLKSVLLKIEDIISNGLSNMSGLNNFHEIYTFYLIWTKSLLNNIPFSEAAKVWLNTKDQQLNIQL